MEIKIRTADPRDWQGECLIIPVFEDNDFIQDYPFLKSFFPENPVIKNFSGKKGEYLPVFCSDKSPFFVFFLAGAGKQEDAGAVSLRELAANAIQGCRALKVKEIFFSVESFEKFNGGFFRLVQEAVYASLISLYKFGKFKTAIDKEEADPEILYLLNSDSEKNSDLTDAINKGKSDACMVKMARDLDNLPGNMLYPETLSLRAAKLASEVGITCEILDVNELEKANMNCLLAVGHGSEHPPRLVILEYFPKEAKNLNPVVLVGKGITFDSGGLCLKPSANMWQMKSDMSGAGAVLSAIITAARENLPVHITGLLACAENMPGGKAYRPGDILESASGTTVEVINTDAEGRLALCDALAYAQKNWNPELIVDIATLTGACAVALGDKVAGLFSNNEKFAEEFENLGKICGNNVWRLPLWKEYKDEIKSPVADVRHTASREGGAIIAALFLEFFIKNDLPWVHMDIAGVDWNSKNTALCTEGATGFGARLLLEFLRSFK